MVWLLQISGGADKASGMYNSREALDLLICGSAIKLLKQSPVVCAGLAHIWLK